MTNLFKSTGQALKTSNWQGILLFAVMLVVASSAAHAGMPWENSLKTIACDVGVGTVKWLAVIAVILAGIMYGLGELSGPFQKMMQIAAGFSIAVGAGAVVFLLIPQAGQASC